MQVIAFNRSLKSTDGFKREENTSGKCEQESRSWLYSMNFGLAVNHDLLDASLLSHKVLMAFENYSQIPLTVVSAYSHVPKITRFPYVLTGHGLKWDENGFIVTACSMFCNVSSDSLG